MIKTIAHPVPHALIMRVDNHSFFHSEIIAMDSSFSESSEDMMIRSVELQGLKLLSSIDATDLFQVGREHALYPWSNPRDISLHYTFP